MIKLPPAYAPHGVASSTDVALFSECNHQTSSDILSPGPSAPDIPHYYEVHGTLDQGNLHFSVANKYTGFLKVYRHCNGIANLFSKKIKLHVREQVYSVNLADLVQHLKLLGVNLTKSECEYEELRYEEATKMIKPETLEQLNERIWRHLSKKLSFDLLLQYNRSIDQNDFRYALHLVKSGVPVENYWALRRNKSDDETWKELPSETDLCNILLKKFTRQEKSAEGTEILCRRNSPLTRVLLQKNNGVQEDFKKQLIDLLKEWGSSHEISEIRYKVSIRKPYGSVDYRCWISSHTITDKSLLEPSKKNPASSGPVGCQSTTLSSAVSGVF